MKQAQLNDQTPLPPPPDGRGREAFPLTPDPSEHLCIHVINFFSFPGFRKILKKHDKNLATDVGAKWRVENVDVANFYTDKSIDKLIAKTEQVSLKTIGL